MPIEQLKTSYPPIKFQMWDEAHKRMFVWEDVTHRIIIASIIAKAIENVRLLPFSGLQDSNNIELYLDDVCRITVQNEFGSLEILLVQVSYFTDFCSYGFNLRERTIMPTSVRKVEKIGNLNSHPELMDVGKKIKFT